MLDLLPLWDFQRPDESETRFRALLPSVAAHPDDRSELLTQIARAQGLQRRFDEAHATLDEAQELVAHAPGAPGAARARVRCLLERARVLNSSGQPPRALPLFLRAFEAAQAAGESYLAVDAAHMVAIVQPPEGQLAWNERAIALAEASGDERTRGWLGSLLNNLAWAYHGCGEHARALELFERTLTFRLAQGKPEPVRIARWSLARELRALGRTTEALEGQRVLAEELTAAGEKDGFVEEELAECLLALGRPGEARPHFVRAHVLLAADPWLVEKEPERIARLRELGSTSPGA